MIILINFSFRFAGYYCSHKINRGFLLDISFPLVCEAVTQTTLHVDIPSGSSTNITNIRVIPSMSKCKTMLESPSDGKFNAISCPLGTFGESCLHDLCKLHQLIEIKGEVVEEKRWLNLNVPVPNENCSPPDKLLIAAFKKLLFENNNDRVVLGKDVELPI